MLASTPTANGRSWKLWSSRRPLSDIEKQQPDSGIELKTGVGSPAVRSAITQISPPFEKSLRIIVGRGGDQRTFQLPKDKLCACSDYFKGTSIKRSASNSFELLDDNPEVFHLFATWVQNQESPVPYDPVRNSASEPWVSNAAAAWVLGNKLRATGFKKYALSLLIQTCALAPFGPWSYIEREAPAESPIRRFSNHWVAWNSYLTGKQSNEYSGLDGASRVYMVTKDTRDPRIFDIDHWYLSCAKSINSKCDHNPEVVRQKMIDDARKAIPPQLDYGRDFETRKTTINPSMTSSTFNPPYFPPTYAPYAPPVPNRSRRSCCTTTMMVLLCMIYITFIGIILWQCCRILFLHQQDISINHSIILFSFATACVGGLAILFYPLIFLHLVFAVTDGIVLAYFRFHLLEPSQGATQLTVLTFLTIPFGILYFIMMKKLLN